MTCYKYYCFTFKAGRTLSFDNLSPELLCTALPPVACSSYHTLTAFNIKKRCAKLKQGDWRLWDGNCLQSLTEPWNSDFYVQIFSSSNKMYMSPFWLVNISNISKSLNPDEKYLQLLPLPTSHTHSLQDMQIGQTHFLRYVLIIFPQNQDLNCIFVIFTLTHVPKILGFIRQMHISELC